MKSKGEGQRQYWGTLGHWEGSGHSGGGYGTRIIYVRNPTILGVVVPKVSLMSLLSRERGGTVSPRDTLAAGS